jgi:hypothetical protein
MSWLSLLTGVLALAASPTDADPSGPALRFYQSLDAPVELSIDQLQPLRIEAKTLNKFPLTPGDHAVEAHLQDGAVVRVIFPFREGELIESHGRKWWCVGVVQRGQGPVLVKMDPDRCKAIADAGPD